MTAADPRTFFAQAVASRPEGPLVVVLPAPAVDPLEAVRRVRRGDAWLLSRGEGDSTECVLGLGSVRAVRLQGDGRMETLAAAAREVPAWIREVHLGATPRLAERLPLWLVGLAFEAGGAREEAWRDHGDGAVVIPRWTYLRSGRDAVLAWASEDRWPGQASVAVGELDALLAALEAPSRARGACQPVVVAQASQSGSAWVEHVERARRSIAEGELRKVVAARRTVVSTAVDVCAEDVLAALPSEGALRYLVRQGGSVVVGATPERLFSKRGTHISTEALAGTRARSEASAEQSLLGSAKDLEEHAPVVAAIVASLRDLGAQVRVETAARAKAVANLVHLRTGIEAELPVGSSTDAATVLGALHPTPAVGGWPTAAARVFIRTHEAPRGWYAGPLGWFDATGDADVHVMLRCALLRGARAWVYAGGGIVATSDPMAEWDETSLKMAPLLSALGARAETRPAPVSPTIRARDVPRDPGPAEASR